MKIIGMTKQQIKQFSKFNKMEIITSDRADQGFIVLLGSTTDDAMAGQYHSNGFMTCGRHDSGFEDFVMTALDNELHTQRDGRGIKV